MASTLMKKLSMPFSIAAAAGLAFATATGANAATFTGSGFAIPDNNATGVSSTISITDNFTIADVTVTLNNITHSWMGDLVASLTHLTTGTKVNLFDRVGRITSGFGNSTNLSGNYSFNDTFTDSLWTTAAGLNSSANIPSGNYYSTAATGTVSLLSAFSGQSALGDWQLNIQDRAGGDTGSLGSWSLTLTPAQPAQPVPEPASAFSLLALGAMGAGSMLKRKQQQKATVKA
ncbi:MAG: proprotein convertase P-domain-containing protein [Oscillatoria princeps RMCB-10]|jgi:subtilisin-like proprotein convertase family protein|nr:proprotein convertase P-domain-containing protein [Oscillatoria princeps RMCB-10]